MKPHLIIVVLLFILVSVAWFNNKYLLNFRNQRYENKNVFFAAPPNEKRNSKEELFSNNVVRFEYFKQTCYRLRHLRSIEDMIVFVNLMKRSKRVLCKQTYRKFAAIFNVRNKYTSIVVSDTFMLKVKKWLNGDKQLIEATKNQSLIFVDNLYTHESVVFNPVRSRRPGVAAGDVKIYIDRIVNESKASCDFCSYKKNTAADGFGYMTSQHSVIVSNTFKIEKYHGMVLLSNHNPIVFNQLEFIDAIHLGLQWFERTHKQTPSHRYRFIYWDILPKASASQIHPHLHLMLGDYAYYSKWNKLYHAGLLFAEREHMNYWKTLLQVHEAMGLVFSFGRASVMAYLTPQKDFEVVIISARPCLQFFRLVYHTIRAFIEDLKQYAVSSAMVFPKLADPLHTGKEELPMLMRLISRGPADNARSDISSFDLFGTPNVNKDPVILMQVLRKSLSARVMGNFDFPDWKYE